MFHPLKYWNTMGIIKMKVQRQRLAALNRYAYVTRPCRYSRIDAEDLISYASQNSGINRGQLAASLYAFQQEFENFLCNGHSVELPALGSFRFSVRAHASDTAEGGGAAAVWRRKIIFRPSPYVCRLLAGLSLETGEVAGT